MKKSPAFLVRWEPFLERYFSLDIRSLALVRMGLALVMLGQLISYSGSVSTFFTDSGVLPRSVHRVVLDDLGFGSAWTLYSLDGSQRFVTWLMRVHFLASLLLLAGCFTRAATIVCLVMAYSLQMRNPLITTGGDVLLRCLLAWAIFLPMGAAASMDSLWRPAIRWPASQVASVASAGFILQLACLYFFAGLAKLNEWWMDGEAIGMALQLEMYVKPFGERLLAWPMLLKLGTWITLGMELGILFFLFSPRGLHFFRGVGCALFILLHIVIGMSMSIGIFSATCIVAWMALIPKDTWPSFSNRLIRVGSSRRSRRFEESRAAWVMSSLLLAAMLGINIGNAFIGRSGAWLFRDLKDWANLAMINQEFKMFGEPPLWNPEFKYVADTRRHETVDLFQLKTMRDREELRPYESMQSQAWRRYHWNLMALHDLNEDDPMPSMQVLLDQSLAFQKQRYNRTFKDDPIETAEFLCSRKKILPLGKQGLSESETLTLSKYRATSETGLEIGNTEE